MPDLPTLLQGNNLVYIILAVLAYFVLIGKKDPAPPPPPVVDPNVPPTPPVVVPPVITVPADHPLINQLLQLLVQYGPILLPLILKQQQEQAAKDAAK